MICALFLAIAVVLAGFCCARLRKNSTIIVTFGTPRKKRN